MNRAKICIFCFERNKNVVRIIEGGEIFTRIQKIVNVTFNDERVPTGFCSKCRKIVLLIERGQKTKDDLPQIFDYTKIKLPTKTRR